MVEPVALATLAIDVALGWPAWLYARVGHPVGAIARVLGGLEKRWNRPDLPRRLLGVATIAIVVALTALVALLAGRGVRALGFGWVGVALLAWPGLAQRSLYDHVRPVATALGRGDLPAARGAVAMIVGRDTATLDGAGVARAAIESLAESFCDGIAAPLFWLLVGGLPGLWAYKAINTADSLIGHREERWRAFGWAAARLDDVANWVPARIGAVLICVAGGGGWRVMWRDARNHTSPNAGWTEAAMAGVLELRLAGPIAYDGVVADKPWIGNGRAAATAQDVRRALAVYGRACGLLWVLAGIAAWAS
ncbi:adenosylcobinamide-phosphate synthase CbiB [Sphingomonas sp. LR60]|uniref:adenosylcobinamide-phosphate synthase CbiB n=1 Tax=Sphingomonas sp. LR60 TaxID=3050233 RepID=UPI002FE0E28C